MNLAEAYLLLFVLLVVVAAASVFFKSRMSMVTPIIFAACAVVTLVAQMGVRVREIVEGPFAYLDNAMWILCGAMFSCLLYENGTFQYIFQKLAARKRNPVLQLFLLVLFIAIPGMLTGIAAVSVLTTGLIAGKYLLSKGVEKAKAVEVVAVGAVLGVILPPLCMPGMITVIAHGPAGYPGSYEGYFLPCLVAALPALVVYCAISGSRVLGEVEAFAGGEEAGSPVCLVPLIVVALLLIGHNFLYFVMPFLGYPIIYTIGFVLAVFLKAKSANPLEAAAGGARAAAVEVALMFAFGAATETLTLVGTMGTVSAHMAILNVSGILQAMVLLALVLAVGTLLGPGVAFVLGAFADYIVVEAMYGNTEMALFAMGLVLTVTMFTSLRGSIVEQAGQALEVAGVDGKDVLKKTWLPVALVVLVAVVYAAARVACKGLMI